MIKPKVFFLIFLSQLVLSQTINGDVFNENNERIEISNILIKDVSAPNVTKEFIIAKNGQFSIRLKKTYETILIEVTSNGYIPTTYEIQNPIIEKVYNVDFILKKDETVLLEDIVVVAKKRPFRIKEDTINYNVESYSDGSERKIEEIIKKLPGIEVNENSGEIKYKGKSIETVTLEGDNLFGFNYSLGTKNINVDMVEQVQAIENYSENPLLKGVEQGDKVALNLKLKKGKIDISGNVDYGSGWFERGKQGHNINSNILGITKAYKSFATFAFNNTGSNRSPFDYFGFNFNVEQLKEQDYFAEKIIPETQFSNLISDSRSNINNQFFGNYNAIFKIGKRLSVKTNLYYLQDRITTNQLFQNQYQINSQDFTTTDNTFITKKPQQYRGDLELKYNTSKTSLLEYNIRVRQENIETSTQIIQNETDEFESFLDTKDFYLKQDLLWTKKLSNKKALQLSLFHSINNLPQTYSITPSLFNTNTNKDVQKSEFKKNFLEAKATLLGSTKKDKYSFILGTNFDNTPFESNLFSIDSEGNTTLTDSQNNLTYLKSYIYNTGVYNFNRGKWTISPSYSFTFLNQNLDIDILNQTSNTEDFLFEPAINLKYKLNTYSFLNAKAAYNQNTNAERFFFLNQVLINNRSLINNTPNLDLRKTESYSLLYFNNDLYNQFQLNASVRYQKSTGNFFSNSNITENTTQIQYFFLPQNNSDFNANLQTSKYIPFIESTLKLSSNYTLSNYKNVVNNSDLRENTNQFLNNELFWKTAFDIPINFENTFTWQYSNSRSRDQSAFINHALQNTFKIFIKPSKKWFLILSSDYYLPNTNSKEDFFFLDATLRHRPKSKKWEASFVIKNLTNEENFEQVQTTDVSTSIYRSNLLPRYFLLNLTWNF